MTVGYFGWRRRFNNSRIFFPFVFRAPPDLKTSYNFRAPVPRPTLHCGMFVYDGIPPKSSEEELRHGNRAFLRRAAIHSTAKESDRKLDGFFVRPHVYAAHVKDALRPTFTNWFDRRHLVCV
jgi:hypothetical protein